MFEKNWYLVCLLTKQIINWILGISLNGFCMAFSFFRSHELSYLTKALKTAYIVSWNGSTKYTSRIVLKNLLAMIHVNIVIERKPLTMPIFKHVYEFSPCALKISERRAWSVEMIVWDTEIFWIPKHNNHLKNIYKLLWKFFILFTRIQANIYYMQFAWVNNFLSSYYS